MASAAIAAVLVVVVVVIIDIAVVVVAVDQRCVNALVDFCLVVRTKRASSRATAKPLKSDRETRGRGLSLGAKKLMNRPESITCEPTRTTASMCSGSATTATTAAAATAAATAAAAASASTAAATTTSASSAPFAVG